MFNWFNKKPANPAPVPSPLIPDAVSMAYHDGVVKALRAEIAGLGDDVRQAERAYETAKVRARTSGRIASELLTQRDHARHILREIVALETPGSAHIGRKMAALARTGLPEFAEREAA